MPRKIKLLSDDILIQEAIATNNSKSYWKRIDELRLRGTDNIYSTALSLVDSSDYDEKQVCIDILAQFGIPKKPHSKEVISIFINLLKSESNPKLLNSMLVGLGHNNDFMLKNDIEKIIHFKNHQNKIVRDGLVFALLGIELNCAIDALIFLTEDKYKSIRDWATFGLGTQISKDTPKIRTALWKKVNDKDQDTKLEAIVGLAQRKDCAIKDVIVKELQNGEMGTLIFDAVLELGDKIFLPLLKKNLQNAQEREDINPHWITDLQECIKTMEEKQLPIESDE